MAVDVAKMIRVLRSMREERIRLTKEADKAIRAIEDQEHRVKMALLKHLTDTGQEAARTVEGTAFKKLKVTPRCSDWDAFYKFIYENQRADMLQRRITTKALIGYIKTHKATPPGVGVLEEWTVQVRKPGEAEDLEDESGEG